MIRRLRLAGLLLPILALLASCALWDGGDQATGPVRVVVEPVDGTYLPLGRLLARAVAEELAILGIRAAAVHQPAGAPPGVYVVRGRAEANPQGPKAPGEDLVALIHWTLFDPRGRARGAHTEAVRAPPMQWEYGDPRLLQAIGEATAEALEPFIPPP